MTPNFLNPFEADLKKHRREFIKIEAKSLEVTALNDKLNIKASKFLGIPFYPKARVYPKDKNAKPMLLTAQLNFAEIPKLKNFPESGILQLFLSGTDWYDEDSKIVYHTESEIQDDYIHDFSFIKDEDYEEMPLQAVHKVSFYKSIDNGSWDDCQFDFQFGDLDWLDFTERLTEKEKREFNDYFKSDGHKLGGYAEFTQSDPRDYGDRNESDVQILQIDSEGDIMIGDVGLAHVFISPENLRRKKFYKAYFTWDCC